MQLATRKFTVEQYHQMAEATVFAPEERLELIRGEIKLPLYAESKINEVWLVNLNNSTLEVYRNPQNNIYQDQQILQVNQSLYSLAFPDLVIKINEILP